MKRWTCSFAHRFVRADLPDALPDGTIETLIAAAQSAATSSNLQAWSVIAVQDKARKARLAALAAAELALPVRAETVTADIEGMAMAAGP